MKNKEITTLRGFIGIILDNENDEQYDYFFRGHANKHYKLDPSVFRKNENGQYKWETTEDILFREMIISHPEEFASSKHTIEKLIKMQHFSLPTRLLDITSNPLIALYFSCKNTNQTELDNNGEVIIFKVKKEIIKYYDSDSASCLSNLAKLSIRDKRSISFNKNTENFNDQLVIKKLVGLVREEKAHFENRISPSTINGIVCIKGIKNNTRITSQSGAFFLFGHQVSFDEEGINEIHIQRITIKNKHSILKELDLLNINESTVFPQTDSSAKYIAQKFTSEFKKHN